MECITDFDILKEAVMAPAMLDADQLKTLVAIADTGSFTRAANDVHKTQAAVSMQMRRLEETAGRRLFVKNGRQNKLKLGLLHGVQGLQLFVAQIVDCHGAVHRTLGKKHDPIQDC